MLYVRTHAAQLEGNAQWFGFLLTTSLSSSSCGSNKELLRVAPSSSRAPCGAPPPAVQRWGAALPRCHAIIPSAGLEGAVISPTTGRVFGVLPLVSLLQAVISQIFVLPLIPVVLCLPHSQCRGIRDRL